MVHLRLDRNPTCLAIQHNGDVSYVFLIQNGVAHIHNIKPGVSESNVTEVDGLNPGDVVADSSFAALELIAAVRDHVCLITRLRLDANLFEPAPERRPGQRGRPPLKGKALPNLSAVLADPKPHGPG